MRRKKLEATREGYCLALVTIRREGNETRLTVRELWWLTGLVFVGQVVVEAAGRLALRVILRHYGVWALGVAVSELIGAGWKLAAAWVGVQATVAGILLRSVGWALVPRMI